MSNSYNDVEQTMYDVDREAVIGKLVFVCVTKRWTFQDPPTPARGEDWQVYDRAFGEAHQAAVAGTPKSIDIEYVHVDDIRRCVRAHGTGITIVTVIDREMGPIRIECTDIQHRLLLESIKQAHAA